MPVTTKSAPSFTLTRRARSGIALGTTEVSVGTDPTADTATSAGLVTDTISILLTFKNQGTVKKGRFQQTHNQGLCKDKLEDMDVSLTFYHFP